MCIIYLASSEDPCADPGIFVRGGGGGGVQVSLSKKSSDNLFFFSFFFLVGVLSLFYRSQMVNFKEIYNFSSFERGSNIFQGGGVQLFPGGGGVQLLIPYTNPYNLWFSRGGPDPCPPPLWIRAWDRNEMAHLAAFHQGQLCLPKQNTVPRRE